MGFEIHWGGQGVHKKHEGHLTDREFIHSLEALHSDARFDHARQVIHDLSSVVSHDLTEDTLNEFAALQFGAQNSNPHFKVAFVCQQPDLHQLIERVLLTEGMSTCQTAVVATLDEATQWLRSQPHGEHYGRWTRSAKGGSPGSGS